MNFVAKITRNSLFVLYKRHLIAMLLILLLFITGQFFVGNFMSVSQILLTVKLASFIALFGLCQMIVIVGGGGGLDLSVGFTATLTAVLTASVMDGSNANLWKAILIAVALGTLIGLLNGILSAVLTLPPLVVTMAMASILQGVINVYTAGKNITGKPSPVLEVIAARSTAIVPNILFVLLVVSVLATITLNKTKLGYRLFGVGMNETTAYLSGVSVRFTRLMSFVASGVLASLIGLLLLGNMGIAFKDMGSSYVMPSIAAVVVGGVALSGGQGGYGGVILGAVFLQTLTNLLVAIGWGDAGKWLGFGTVLYLLLSLYASNRRSR